MSDKLQFVVVRAYADKLKFVGQIAMYRRLVVGLEPIDFYCCIESRLLVK
jgi:hypothetical protein